MPRHAFWPLQELDPTMNELPVEAQAFTPWHEFDGATFTV
jgi:hypothetical protein